MLRKEHRLAVEGMETAVRMETVCGEKNNNTISGCPNGDRFNTEERELQADKIRLDSAYWNRGQKCKGLWGCSM